MTSFFQIPGGGGKCPPCPPAGAHVQHSNISSTGHWRFIHTKNFEVCELAASQGIAEGGFINHFIFNFTCVFAFSAAGFVEAVASESVRVTVIDEKLLKQLKHTQYC